MNASVLMQKKNYCSHQDILMKCEILSLPRLSGKIMSMYPIMDQCRVELVGQDGTDENNPLLRKWVYSVTLPIMCITNDHASRGDIHFPAELFTPFSEEKMRFGCQLHVDCEVYPRCAAELNDGNYRVTYDAHISLYSMLLRAG